MMNAMLFAAGKGTRLKPLTDFLPKALVPVGDKPLLQHVLEKLTAAGASTIVINVHHKAEQIKNFIDITHNNWNADIRISDETEQLLETGGGIKKASKLLDNDSPILLHNVDILSNVNLKEFYEHNCKYDATLLVSERKTTRYLLFDDDMRLVGWTNTQTGEVRGKMGSHRYAFSGIHIIGHNLISEMEAWPDHFPIMDFYLDLCTKYHIHGHVKKDLRLMDVGKMDTIDQAEDFLQTLNK